MRILKPDKRAGQHIICSILLFLCCPVGAENWPAWRGPRGDGTSIETNVPTRWTDSENIAWKVSISGEGHSSPIIWDNRLFLTTASKETEDRLLLCLEARTGATLWQQTILHAPLEAKNNENSYASATPVTDGQHVYVTFLDKDDVVVAAVDFQGKQLWTARPGKFKSQWGFCHSPALFQDKLIVVAYSKGENFVVALSKADGKTLWKTPCESPSQSYSAPLIRRMGGRDQLVALGNKAVTSYDLATGRVLWFVDGLSDDSVVTPVYHQKTNLLLSCTSWPNRVLMAIKPDGTGNVTATKVAWKTAEGAPYVPSPIAIGDWFLTSSYNGKAAHCYEAATGTILWKEPIGLHHASPVTANGLVYFLNDDGVTHVLQAGPEFKLVASNELGEKAYASPAITSGHIFLRTFNHLYCIGAISSR